MILEAIMLKYSANNHRFNLYLLCFIILIYYSIGFSQSQSKKNLEVIYLLTDSLVNKIVNEIPGDQKKILLTLNLGSTYSLFENNIKTAFIKNGLEILEQPPDELNIPSINIVIEGAGIEYGEIFRAGWFGTHFLTRRAAIFGNYIQSYSEKGKEDFEINAFDTIKVEDIKELENESFPFTQANIPPEPFLSGVAEPLIAVGTAAVIIILFFSIRSK